MNIEKIRKVYNEILKNVNKVIVGKEEAITLIITALLSEGHVLIEDNPGTGKTTLVKTMAKTLGLKFSRVQFTPDLLPQDITGIKIYNQESKEFNLIEGPVFTNFLLADEINRATPRTQSALLEAMEERQATIDGDTRMLERPFLVIATENSIETAGTYPLPEAELDRFMIKLDMGKLSNKDEARMLKLYGAENPSEEIQSVLSKDELCEAIEEIKKVFIHDCIINYIVEIADMTRNNPNVAAGVSPRASLMLLRAVKSFAAVSGRDYVTPDDVKYLAPYVFAHRILTYSIASYNECKEIIEDILKKVKAPVEDWKIK